MTDKQDNKRSMYIGTIVFIGIVLLFSTSCTKLQKDNTLTMGVLSWPGVGPVYIGDEKGFFRDEGINLEIKIIGNYDSRRAALISGQIDIDYNTMDQLLIYWEAGYEAQIFGVGDFSTGGDGILATKEISSIKELKGKTITYAEATPSDFLLRYILKKNGIPTDSVNLKPVAEPQIAGNAIIAEQVDAASTHEPWLTQATENENLHLLVSTKEYPYLIPGLLIAAKNNLNEKEELFKKFTKAWFRSAKYYKENPKEAKEIMAKRMEISLDELESILSGLTILTMNDNKTALNKNEANNMYELVDYLSEFWKEGGFISKTFDADDLINNNLYE